MFAQSFVNMAITSCILLKSELIDDHDGTGADVKETQDYNILKLSAEFPLSRKGLKADHAESKGRRQRHSDQGSCGSTTTKYTSITRTTRQ